MTNGTVANKWQCYFLLLESFPDFNISRKNRSFVVISNDWKRGSELGIGTQVQDLLRYNKF